MKTVEFQNAITKINAYLSSDKTSELCLKFGQGFYLRIRKRLINAMPYIEIHTSGFDGTLAAPEAVDWIKWTLLDYRANDIC